MADKREPSNTDLVYQVFVDARRPLTFQELFDEVNRRRPVTTKNPKATIRGALTQSRLLLNLGDGRFGYLPYLLTGSLLRLPFTEKKPANHPLSFTDEVHFALWPSSTEIEKRRVTRPARLRLPDGEEVS